MRRRTPRSRLPRTPVCGDSGVLQRLPRPTPASAAAAGPSPRLPGARCRRKPRRNGRPGQGSRPASAYPCLAGPRRVADRVHGHACVAQQPPDNASGLGAFGKRQDRPTTRDHVIRPQVRQPAAPAFTVLTAIPRQRWRMHHLRTSSNGRCMATVCLLLGAHSTGPARRISSTLSSSSSSSSRISGGPDAGPDTSGNRGRRPDAGPGHARTSNVSAWSNTVSSRSADTHQNVIFSPALISASRNVISRVAVRRSVRGRRGPAQYLLDRRRQQGPVRPQRLPLLGTLRQRQHPRRHAVAWWLAARDQQQAEERLSLVPTTDAPHALGDVLARHRRHHVAAGLGGTLERDQLRAAHRTQRTRSPPPRCRSPRTRGCPGQPPARADATSCGQSSSGAPSASATVWMANGADTSGWKSHVPLAMAASTNAAARSRSLGTCPSTTWWATVGLTRFRTELVARVVQHIDQHAGVDAGLEIVDMGAAAVATAAALRGKRIRRRLLDVGVPAQHPEALTVHTVSGRMPQDRTIPAQPREDLHAENQRRTWTYRSDRNHPEQPEGRRLSTASHWSTSCRPSALFSAFLMYTMSVAHVGMRVQPSTSPIVRRPCPIHVATLLEQ